MSVLAMRIRDRRKRLGLNQEGLAEIIHIAQSQISKYERGEHEPTAEVLVLLARALNTSTDWLLGLTDDPNPVVHVNDLTNAERAIIDAIRRGDPYEAIRAIVGGDKEARSGA